MKVKRFQAKDFREALSLVRKEMGQDAVILSSKERKGFVEVAAAADFSMEAVPSGQAEEVTRADKAADNKDIMQIQRDLRGLKNTFNELKKKGYELNLPEDKKEIYKFLRRKSINEDLALRLSEKVLDLDELVSMVSSTIRTMGEGAGLKDKKAVLVIGPTGVGKTTTIAKLAARAVKQGRSVALINLDAYRIGAVEQIRIYSNILGVPLDVVSGVKELKQSLLKYAEKDMVFIDTTGRNPGDESHIRELKTISKLGFSIQTHLLMSASSDGEFMAKAYSHYKDLPIDCLAFSKVDEAVRFGSIYNLAALSRKPIAYITTGQRVPHDIEFPDSKALAGLVLESPVCGAA